MNTMIEKKLGEFEVVEMCVTSRCNLKCTHCYQSLDKNKYQLSFNQIKDVIDFSLNYNVKKYVLSGGEFFLHPDAYGILAYILKNTDAQIVCVTNLTLVDIDAIKNQIPINKVSFKVSIDGDEEEHNKRRGSGMFAITKDKIRKLRNLGYSVEITMTLVEDNIHCIPTILSDKDFDKITFMPVATTGAACNNFCNKKDSRDYSDVITHIYKTCREYVNGEYRCYIFPRSFSVKYDGGIYPCSLSRDYDLFNMGNICNKSIQQVITEFVASSRSDIFFEYQKNNQIEKCNHCVHNNECTRGCRIRAYKWNGTLLSSDPFACKIFRNEYPDIPFGSVYWGTKK